MNADLALYARLSSGPITIVVMTLFNCVQRFENKLPDIFKDVHEAYEQIDARLKAEQFKVSLYSQSNYITFYSSMKW